MGTSVKLRMVRLGSGAAIAAPLLGAFLQTSCGLDAGEEQLGGGAQQSSVDDSEGGAEEAALSCEQDRDCAELGTAGERYSCLEGTCSLFRWQASDEVLEHVGDPCDLSFDLSADADGFSQSEVIIDHDFTACGQGSACILHHFQGRFECPYGQDKRQAKRHPQCFLEDGNPVTVAVAPQLLERRPQDVQHCSCKCAGPVHPGEELCTCGDGFECAGLIEDLGFGDTTYVGSYCVREGTAAELPLLCDPALGNCD